MIKLLTLFVATLSFTACASMQNMMKSNFAKKAETLGIAATDVEAVDRQSQVYYGDYQRTASQKVGLNDQMLQTQVNAQMTKITNIFCGCVKKLGDKCQANPAGMSGTDKDMWVKGNGAAEALSLIQKSNVDAMSCPS
ncbi:MAG: hypothetical protein EOP04_13915 [Proteobacteria bacterium]|nr:MAG: hypothetical protein EOP04_13915 [Pseudomonadota bacterium]